MTKVLVAIPTYEGGKYCRDVFIKFLKTLNYLDLEFLFVTNSGEEDKKELENLTSDLNARVLINEEQHSPGHDQVVSNRNLLREEFLKTDAEYLFFLDHDVVGPKNAIQVLLSHEKKVCTGWYLGAFNYDGVSHVLPVVYVDSPKEPGKLMQLAMQDVLVPRFIPIGCAGLGCTLIHRSILENISFRREKGTEDATFYLDVQNSGEKVWLDTRASFWHLKLPPGDKRNNLLDPRRYKLKARNSSKE